MFSSCCRVALWSSQPESTDILFCCHLLFLGSKIIRNDMTGKICLFSFGYVWEGNRTSLHTVAGRTDLTGSDRQQKRDYIKISFPSAHPPAQWALLESAKSKRQVNGNSFKVTQDETTLLPFPDSFDMGGFPGAAGWSGVAPRNPQTVENCNRSLTTLHQTGKFSLIHWLMMAGLRV